MADVEKLVGSESPLEVGQKINEIIEKGVGGTGYVMFDTIYKDHVLTYEESKGLALQGTYVYKEAIAGSRYGYPDFYNKVLEEFNQATETETVNEVIVRVHSNGHKFYDIADKEGIDSFFDTMGSAWFYGVDIENKRIFLPRNNYFDQITNDVSEVGKTETAGIPNITGQANIGGVGTASSYPIHIASTTGAFGVGNTSATVMQRSERSGSKPCFLTIDASKVSSVYGNSTTVQPNSVKKLLYICVGNTVVETPVTEVADVATTENDTIPLFTGMYFDFKPNNPSWLIAGGQEIWGGIYTTCYNELVNILNGETKYVDLKVVDKANMINGIDYSEYWKVNQDNMTFTTPTAISNKAYSDIASVVGNGNAMGLYDGTNQRLLYQTSNSSNVGLSYTSTDYASPVLAGSSDSGSANVPALTVGLSTNPNLSGIEAHLQENEKAHLYFKVSNAVQNLELLDVGKVLEAVADISSKAVLKTENKAYIIETYVNGTSGYRVWSDKYCEQWGRSTGGTSYTGTYLKPFINSDYNFLAVDHVTSSSDTDGFDFTVAVSNLTTTGFRLTQASDRLSCWRAYGYIA